MLISTRQFRRTLLIIASTFLLASRHPAQAQQPASFNSADQLQSARRGVTPLIDQLRVGLRTNQSSQLAFLQLVVSKVEQGELPQSMIYVVYRWAISKNERYPYPYFHYAMTELAKRRGVTL